MDYKTKYLKYKLKYLNAKKIYGGSEVSRRKLLKQAIRRSWLDANPKDNTEKDLYEEDSEVEDSEVEDSEVEDIDTDEDTDEYTDLYISSEDEDEDLYISSEDEDEDGEELKISKSVSEAELAETEAQAEDTAMIDAEDDNVYGRLGLNPNPNPNIILSNVPPVLSLIETKKNDSMKGNAEEVKGEDAGVEDEDAEVKAAAEEEEEAEVEDIDTDDDLYDGQGLNIIDNLYRPIQLFIDESRNPNPNPIINALKGNAKEVKGGDLYEDEEGAENDDGAGFYNIIQPIQQQQQQIQSQQIQSQQIQSQQIQSQPILPQLINHILGYILQMINQITTREERRRRRR